MSSRADGNAPPFPFAVTGAGWMAPTPDRELGAKIIHYLAAVLPVEEATRLFPPKTSLGCADECPRCGALPHGPSADCVGGS